MTERMRVGGGVNGPETPCRLRCRISFPGTEVRLINGTWPSEGAIGERGPVPTPAAINHPKLSRVLRHVFHRVHIQRTIYDRALGKGSFRCAYICISRGQRTWCTWCRFRMRSSQTTRRFPRRTARAPPLCGTFADSALWRWSMCGRCK